MEKKRPNVCCLHPDCHGMTGKESCFFQLGLEREVRLEAEAGCSRRRSRTGGIFGVRSTVTKLPGRKALIKWVRNYMEQG